MAKTNPQVFSMATPARAGAQYGDARAHEAPADDASATAQPQEREAPQACAEPRLSEGKATPSLPDHLKVAQQLGKGAYGDVFLCVDTRDNSQVAIKWIKGFTRDPQFGKRIVREIRILAALEHPNLVKLIDMLPVPGPVFDDVYIVMPYMHLDMHKVIYSKMKLSDSHAEAFACQILHGLRYLHAAGVVHRDIKPSNILVNKDCTLRIADLGLARGRMYAEEELTDYVVTRWYRAPELLLMPSGYFEAVDLWSVGCIHVELLTRTPLFPGKDHIDMLRKIATVLGFNRERDLAWLPEAGPARESVLTFVESLQLPEFPLQPVEKPLDQLMPDASEACLDFVQELLTVDPTKRISASDAITHRYLAHLQAANERLATWPVKPFAWDFDSYIPSKENLRDQVYAQCARLHPEILARDGKSVAMPLVPPPRRAPRAAAKTTYHI